MQRFPRAALVALCILTLILGLAARPAPVGAATPRAAYTILVYMNGSNLESEGGAATRDLAEMVRAGGSEQVNVLVQTLGTARWTPPFIAADRNQRWQVIQGDLKLVDDTVGRRPLADPGTLRDFIVWGMKNYPAQRYALIFWDHGGGALFGYGYDELYPDRPSLGIEGIRQGIADALQTTGQSFELIGFDTCLLASTELAAALSPYGRYMVASEELEPGHGWNYTPVLTALQQDPTLTGDRLGRVIADEFRNQAVQYKTDKDITLSVIDLSKVPDVVAAWQQFLAVAAPSLAEEQGLRTLQRARSQAESYGGTADMTDLYDLVSKASDLAPDAAAAVADRIRAAVVYYINSEGTPRASGLSIYFPHKGTAALDDHLARYDQTKFLLPYRQFLSRYTAEALSDKQPVPFAAEQPSAEAAGGRSTRYSVRVQPDQADQVAAVYSILGMVNPEQPDDVILLAFDNNVDFDPKTGEIDDTFADSVVTLNGHYVAMYLEEEGDTYDRYSIPVELNGKPVTLMVLYDYQKNEDVVLGAWPGLDGTSHMAQREIIHVKPGDRIKPLFEFYNEKTHETGHYEGEEFTVKGKLNLEYTDVPEGTYLYGFNVVDFAGNESFSDFTEVQVSYEAGHAPAGEYWEPDDEQVPPEPEMPLQGGAPDGNPCRGWRIGLCPI